MPSGFYGPVVSRGAWPSLGDGGIKKPPLGTGAKAKEVEGVVSYLVRQRFSQKVPKKFAAPKKFFSHPHMRAPSRRPRRCLIPGSRFSPSGHIV